MNDSGFKYKIPAWCIMVFCLLPAYTLFSQPVNTQLQDMVMPAPNAASLGKYGDIPVSLATGVPNISIPIYQITEGALQFPISVSYHASGIKVGETASWVGAGWTLNAGGSISRTVLGLPDEKANGYVNVGSTVDVSTDEEVVAEGSKDAEADIFSYNFNGVSGKFLMDDTGEFHVMPQQDIEIEAVILNYNFIRFILTTPDGTRYIFGNLEGQNTDKGIEKTALYPDPSGEEEEVPPSNSSWHLVRVESFDQNFWIELDYITEEYSYNNLSSCTTTFYEFNCTSGVSYGGDTNCSGIYAGNNLYYTTMSVEGKRLSRITTSTGHTTIDFVPTTADREDLDAYLSSATKDVKALDRIEVNSGTNNDYCMRWQFGYDYFEDPSTNWSDGKRLQLTTLQQSACNGSDVIPPHFFTYEGPVNGNGSKFLSRRLSKAVDHWGFYNGATSNNSHQLNIPKTTETVFQAGASVPITLGESRRHTNPEKQKFGVLKDITYPTGGKTWFTFESNDHRKTVSGEDELMTLSNCDILSAEECCPVFSRNGVAYLSQHQVDFGYFTLTGEVTEDNEDEEDCLNSYTQLHEVEIEVRDLETNALIGVYSFNVEVGGTNYHEETHPLSFLGTFTPEREYRFWLRTTNIKGGFRLFADYPSGTIVNEKVGGLRISQLRSGTEQTQGSNDIIRTYDYLLENGTNESSGNLFVNPKYSYKLQPIASGIGGYFLLFQANSIVPLGSYNGVKVGYSRVVENHNGNGSRTHHFFIEPPGNPTEFPVPPTKFRAKNGKLQKEEIKKQNGNLVSSQIHNPLTQYQNISGNMFKTNKLIFECANSSIPFFLYQTTTYIPFTGFYLIDSKVETVDGLSNTTDFDYNSNFDHFRPIKEEFTDSEGKTITQEFKYPDDLSPTSVITALKNQNRVALPLETRLKVDNVLINGNITEYSFYNQSNGTPSSSGMGPYPYYIDEYEATWVNGSHSGAWDIYGLYDEYHPDGMPKKFTVNGWDPEYFEWDGGLMTERQFGNHTWTFNFYPGTRLLSSKTEVDGQTVNYEYDQLMRLTDANERSNNVLTDYEYVYQSGTGTHNYIKTRTSFNSSLNSDLSFNETRQYFDGLGREIQTVVRQHSESFKDVVSAREYDNQGRVSRAYKPFESTLGTGAFRSIPAGTPFDFNQYETAPTNRVVSKTPPGWYATTTTYGANNSSEVANLATGGFYGANQLAKMTVTDPNGNKTISFTDKRGREVLIRKTNSSGSQSSNTYKIYDDKDRVEKIVPPGAGINSTNLIFEYEYDGADNITKKWLPGSAVEEMRYNFRDKVAATRSGSLAAQNKWLVYQYDIYGRLSKKGFFNGTNPPSNLQSPTINELLEENFYDGFDGTSTVSGPQYTGKLRKSRTRSINGFNPGSTWIETVYSYDTWGRVSSTNGNNQSNQGLGSEQVVFSYDFADNNTIQQRTSQAFGQSYNITKRTTFDHKGRKKDMFMQVGSGPETKTGNLRYNHRDEVIEKNLGGYGSTFLQSLDYEYNDQGWMESINNSNFGVAAITINTCPSTAVMPSPTSSSSVDNNDLFHMEFRYDFPMSNLGISPQKNGNISQIMWRVRGRQRQTYGFQYDYQYRLTNANYGNVSDAGSLSLNNDFSTDYSYDARGNITSLQRNGLVWTGSCWDDIQIDNLTYTYYANSNRLRRVTDAANCPSDLGVNDEVTRPETFQAANSVNANSTVTGGQAVGMRAGNEVTLTPGFNVKAENAGDFTADIGLCNSTTHPFTEGFVQRSNSDYLYDANGNLSNDPQRGHSITYNHLNLPHKVTSDVVGAIREIEFVYTASGEKLSKVVRINGVVQYTHDYLGNIEYRDGIIKGIYHDDGRITNTSGTTSPVWQYEYTINDHLGNARIRFADKDGDGKIEITSSAVTSEVLEENHYYPFGMEMKGPWLKANSTNYQYKYNAKERHDDFDLGWYNFGARFYDPTVARFTGVDPIGDQFPHVSVYNYAENEPVTNIDYHGLQKVEVHQEVAKDELLTTTWNAMLKTSQHVVSELNNAEQLGVGLAQLDFVLTVGGLINEYKSREGMTEEEIEESDKRVAVTIIGEIASFANPIIGFSVTTLLNDALKPDGLTNLDNGRMATAYSQGLIQNRAGNYHLQRALAQQRAERARKRAERNAERNRPKTRVYYSRPYVSISVAAGRKANGQMRYKEKRFYKGSDMYDLLTSEANDPGAPGHNPTTRIGFEIDYYEY